MAGMFARAASFNQSLDKWNTSCVVDMSYTFRHAVVFNQASGSWASHGLDQCIPSKGEPEINQRCIKSTILFSLLFRSIHVLHEVVL